MKNLINKSVLKKLSYIGLIIVVIAFFAIPSFIFADEGDATTWVGIDPSQPQQSVPGTTAGQYLIGDDDDTLADSENDGDTEVFCIDGDKYLVGGDNQYVPTNIDVSDEIVGETDLEGAPGVVTPVEAVAAEILSSTATGATAVEDQVAMWQFTGDNPTSFSAMSDPRTSETSQEGQVQAIIVNVEALAQEYVTATGYSQLNPNPETNTDPITGTLLGKPTIDQFLADKEINSIEVTVQQDSTIFTGGNGTAIATMDNSLVPEITDANKDVYWYILAGSFNISFSKTSLVFQTGSNSAAAGTNPSKMNDVDGSVIDLTDPTASGYVASKADNYGEAKVDYYYLWWGLADYPQDTMGVNLFAWADIDKDAKFDFIDLSSENPGGDTDGNAVANFQSKYEVVQNIVGAGTPDDPSDDSVTTAPINMPMDVHEVEGGKVVIANADLNKINNDSQRFATQSYTEAYNIDPKFFGTLIFKYTGNNTPLSGAQFGVFSKPDATDQPLAVITTDVNGYASTGNNGLEYGTYYVKEMIAPSGYDLNTTIYPLTVSGKGVGTSQLISGNGSRIIDPAPFNIINTPTPTPTPIPTPTPDGGGGTTTLTVAGLTEGTIQVLAFTGLNPIIPIAGMGTVLIGFGLFIVSLKKRAAWKHVANK